MPEKLKKSIKLRDKQTGKMKTEHYYLKSTPLTEIMDIIDNQNTKPKIRAKCRREVIRRWVAKKYGK